MSTSFKPTGYNSVSPYLIVNGARGTVEFLKEAFGAEELRTIPNESGGLMHAEVRIDDTVVMLSDGNTNWPTGQVHVHVYVRDVDAVYRSALAAGGRSVQEPIQKNDEDKRGGVVGPGGITWWVATRVG